MERDNNFRNTVNSLFEGIENFMSTKTVVGEPIHLDDTIILPLVDLSFGIGAGAFAGDKKDNGGGGIGGKMTPSALLVISPNGATKLVNIKNASSINKVLDLVPDLVERFAPSSGDENEDTVIIKDEKE